MCSSLGDVVLPLNKSGETKTPFSKKASTMFFSLINTHPS